VNNQEKDSLKKTCKKECMNFKKDTWNKERMKDAISKNWLNF
jgi:thioredoxin-related protein